MGNRASIEEFKCRKEQDSALAMDFKLLREAVEGRPEDASDVPTLQASLKEVVKLRKLVNAVFERFDMLYPQVEYESPVPTEILSGEEEGPDEEECPVPGKIRAAVCGFKGRTVGNDNIEVEHSEQSEEVKNMLNQIVANSFLFVGLLPAFRDELIKIFTPVVYLPGENATTQGEEEDYFYAVESGKLSVFIKSPDSEEAKYIRDYGPGDSFGELALMYGNPRAATVKVIDKSQLWCVSRSKLRNALTRMKNKELKKKVEMLQKVNIGQETLGVLLSSEDVLRLAEALEFIHFTDGHCIVHQGNIGEVFYIIYDGTIRVEVDNIEVGKLTVGGYFGERALLRLKLK